MTDWNVLCLTFLAALGISVALAVPVFLASALWKFSGYPLNEHKDAGCEPNPDLLDPGVMGLKWSEAIVYGELGNMPAWHVPADPDKANRKWVILVHGRGGSPASSVEMLPALQKAGYSSLSITYRGDGIAPEPPDGLDHLGDHEWRDLERAVELAVLAEADEIVLYGRSAGGQIVGQFLLNGRAEYVSKVTHVVLDCPVLNWQATFLAMRPDWMPAWVARVICWVSSLRVGKKMRSFDLTERFKDAPAERKPRLMIVHGTKDEVVPYAETERFYNAHHKTWGPFIVVGVPATHTGVRAKDPSWYDLLVATWIQATYWNPEAVKEILEDSRER